METITFERTGDRPLEFEGEYLFQSGAVQAGTGRSYRGEIARTRGGTFVAHVHYSTQWDGDEDRDYEYHGGVGDVTDWIASLDPIGLDVESLRPHPGMNGRTRETYGIRQDMAIDGWRRLRGQMLAVFGPERID